MTLQQQTFWKIWGTPLSVVLGFSVLAWTITTTVGGIIHSDLKELHGNSTAILNIQNERREESKNKLERIKLRDEWDRRQDEYINALQKSMGIVKDRLHIADED